MDLKNERLTSDKLVRFRFTNQNVRNFVTWWALQEQHTDAIGDVNDAVRDALKK
jgi:hypothetical protein